MKTFLKTTGWLVMAAALSFGIAACSSDDDAVKQPQNPAEPQVYTMVIQASKGDISTRALRPADASGIDAYWSGDEKIDVVINDSNWKLKKIGTATAAANDGLSTTITATLNEAPSGEVYFYLHGANIDYTGQNGLLIGTGSISEKYDYTRGQLSEEDYTVNGNEIIPNENVTLVFSEEAYQAIVKFTLLDKETDLAINATSLTIHDENGWITQTWDAINDENPVKGDIIITPSGNTNEIYVALSGVDYSKLTLTASDGTNTYTYTTPASNITFYGGKYYTRTVKMTKVIPAEPAEGHALSASAVGEIVCSDGLAYAAADKDNLPTGVTAVAIVAYLGDGDTSDNTYNNGLAIAMKNANDGSGCRWGDYFVSYNCVSKSNDIATAIGFKDGISSTNTLTSDGHYHEAATAAVSNNSTAAPTGTSGWFLPSMGQWNLIVQGLASKKAGSAVTTDISTSGNDTYTASNLNSVITDAGGTGFNSDSGYQSSTQYDSDDCWHMEISSGRASNYVFYAGDYVRSVLAF